MQLEHDILENLHQQSLLQEEFISHITHELRDPLVWIKGYTTTLLRKDISWKRDAQLEFLSISDQETD